MNKKNLSMMSLLTLCVALIGGCGKGDKNVSDIVLQVGDKKFTADQLYNQLLSTGTGANEAFSIVLRLVVESSMETTTNIQTAADLAEETFEEEVETYAQTNGLSVKDARKTLLEEKGYESVDELKADVIYKQKLTRVTEQYWENNKGSFYNDYISNRLPYLVSHVLVKVDDNTNGNKIANNVNVSQAEAEKLANVINRFKDGDSFSYVANHFSDDSGSTATGGAYYMDTTTSFVDEFLYGTYIFDAYTEKVTEGEGASANTYYKWGRTAKYDILKDVGFINEDVYEAPEGETTPVDQIAKYYEDGLNFVGMDIVEKLGDVANKTSTGDFHYIGYVKDENYVSDSGVTEYDSSINNLNSNYNAYARSIIFNRAFNKTGLSVVGYETREKAEEAGALEHCVEIRNTANGTSKWVLAAGEGEDKTPIFFVAARGSSNDVWVHFLTINVSSLQSEYDVKVDDDAEHYARKYFTINPKDNDSVVSYAEDPRFNVDGSKSTKNKLISEIEDYIKSYVTAGSGSSVGQESLLTYKMLEHYMKKNDIDWADKNLKKAIEAYISKRRAYLNATHNNKLLETFNKHADKLTVSESELVQMGIKPYECAVVLDSSAYAPINSSTSTGNLCRYVYGKGYQVKLSYYYHTNLVDTGSSYTKITTTTDVLSFTKDDQYAGGYKQWAYIGEEVTLPTPRVKDGYRFDGWYTTSDFKPGTEVTKADLTTSSIYNHTIFYAKVVTIADSGTYNVEYEYKFVDSDVEVDESLITNTNIKTAAFAAGGTENTHTIYLNNTTDGKTITSDAYQIIGFASDGSQSEYEFTLNGENITQGVKITVYVAPKPVQLDYIYVDSEGNASEVTVNSNANPQTYEYDLAEGAENNLVVDASKFACGDGYEVKSIKYARNDKEFDEADDEFEVEQTDLGTTIKVYVVIGEQ